MLRLHGIVSVLVRIGHDDQIASDIQRNRVLLKIRAEKGEPQANVARKKNSKKSAALRLHKPVPDI
jgi:hypothetical protein